MGLGLERILMVRKNIKDIRLLRSTNEKVLCQMNDLELYNEVSSMPPVIRDISVVVDKNLDIELLGDMIRDSDIDEKLIDKLSEYTKRYGRFSYPPITEKEEPETEE